MPRSISLMLSASILASVNSSSTTLALLVNGARWGAVMMLYSLCLKLLAKVKHDPDPEGRVSAKWKLVFPRDKREAFARRSCSNRKTTLESGSTELNQTPANSFGRLRGGQIAGAKPHAGGDADAVIRIGTVEMRDLALDDLRRHAIHRGLDVVEQLFLLIGAHQPEQVADLTVIVVAVPMVVAVGVAGNRQRRLLDADILHRTAHRVRFVKGIRVGMAGEPH